MTLTPTEELSNRRQRIAQILSNSQVFDAIKQVMDCDALLLKPDLDISCNVGAQSEVLNVLRSFRPEYLRLVLEAVFKVKLDYKDDLQFTDNLSFIASKRIFHSPSISKNRRLSYTRGNWLTEEGKKAVERHFFTVICQILFVMEECLMHSVIPDCPYMFKPNIEFESINDVFSVLSRELISGKTLLPRVLETIRFKPAYISPPYPQEEKLNTTFTSDNLENISPEKQRHSLTGTFTKRIFKLKKHSPTQNSPQQRKSVSFTDSNTINRPINSPLKSFNQQSKEKIFAQNQEEIEELNSAVLDQEANLESTQKEFPLDYQNESDESLNKTGETVLDNTSNQNAPVDQQTVAEKVSLNSSFNSASNVLAPKPDENEEIFIEEITLNDTFEKQQENKKEEEHQNISSNDSNSMNGVYDVEHNEQMTSFLNQTQNIAEKLGKHAQYLDKYQLSIVALYNQLKHTAKFLAGIVKSLGLNNDQVELLLQKIEQLELEIQETNEMSDRVVNETKEVAAELSTMCIHIEKSIRVEKSYYRQSIIEQFQSSFVPNSSDKKETNELTAKNNEQAQQIQMQNNEISKLKQQLDELCAEQENHMELVARNAELLQKEAFKTKEVDDLNQQLEDMRSDRLEFETQIIELRDDRDRLETEFLNAMRLADEREKQLEEREKEIEKLQTTLNNKPIIQLPPELRKGIEHELEQIHNTLADVTNCNNNPKSK